MRLNRKRFWDSEKGILQMECVNISMSFTEFECRHRMKERLIYTTEHTHSFLIFVIYGVLIYSNGHSTFEYWIPSNDWGVHYESCIKKVVQLWENIFILICTVLFLDVYVCVHVCVHFGGFCLTPCDSIIRMSADL